MGNPFSPDEERACLRIFAILTWNRLSLWQKRDIWKNFLNDAHTFPGEAYSDVVLEIISKKLEGGEKVSLAALWHNIQNEFWVGKSVEIYSLWLTYDGCGVIKMPRKFLGFARTPHIFPKSFSPHHLKAQRSKSQEEWQMAEIYTHFQNTISTLSNQLD